MHSIEVVHAPPGCTLGVITPAHRAESAVISPQDRLAMAVMHDWKAASSNSSRPACCEAMITGSNAASQMVR
jgi:hypothetical protein